MKTYGQIKYSTVDAPQPIAGICESFNYKLSEQMYEAMGEDNSVVAMVPHGRKGELSFSATPLGTVTALGVRAGAEIAITGYDTGKILVTQASAKWQRGQAMVMDANANHYPDLAEGVAGSITPATITLSQGTPALVLPTGKIWWGTTGISNPAGVEGIVQSCSITESVQVQEEEDDLGKIVAVVLHGYKANGTVEVLTTADLPEPGDTLAVFGTFRITSADLKWQKGATRLISMEGVVVPS